METIILSGVVGSRAYGLSTPESDVDRLGFFVTPTDLLLGLHRPAETQVRTTPDVTLHEVGKAVRLLLGANPTVTELLWLDEHEVSTCYGEDLVGLRTSFLSARTVRNAYFGYASQQLRRLAGVEDVAAGAARIEKHARHLRRLLEQGMQLWRRGELSVRVEDPQAYFDFGKAVVAHRKVAAALLARYEEAFDSTATVLPEAPDERAINNWLVRLRVAFLPG